MTKRTPKSPVRRATEPERSPAVGKANRGGGQARRFVAVISFYDELAMKAALVGYAFKRGWSFSTLGRDMVRTYIEVKGIELPSDEVEAERLVALLSGGEEVYT